MRRLHQGRADDERRTAFREIVSLWANRRALGLLALHDLRRAYAGTAAGVLWTFITPAWHGFAAAYVPWALLSPSVSGATGSIVEHRYLVKRVLFPVEIIPADAVLVHSLPHVFLLTLATAACLIGGYGGFPDVLLVVYFYACAVVFAIAAGLLVSSITVVARDFQQMLPSMLQVWFWLTPIAWASSALPPPGQTLLALNPASYIVSGYRHALMPKAFAAPTAFESAAFWMMTLGLLTIATTVFRRLRHDFWDCL